MCVGGELGGNGAGFSLDLPAGGAVGADGEVFTHGGAKGTAFSIPYVLKPQNHIHFLAI